MTRAGGGARGFLMVAVLGAALSLSTGTVHGAYPGENGKIAFVSDRDGNSEVYVMDADGGNQTRRTNSPSADFSPAWSPDGQKIAFVSDRDGNREIYVMNGDGNAQSRLT